MYTAKIENRAGDLMILTGNEPVYQIVSIQGLNPPPAQINVTSIVGMDGARFNSAKLQTRNLVLTIKINGSVEQNRLQLYRYFRTKEWCTFYYKNGSVDVTIEGYVESLECDLFSNAEMAQISILCPFPYFRSLAQVVADSSAVMSLFVFPFSINEDEPVAISSINPEEEGYVEVYNGSESETGVMLEIDINGDASEVAVKNTTTDEELTLNYSFEDGDKILINTQRGQKSIVLLRGSALTNIFTALQPGSVFFQLTMGSNRFQYTVDDVTGSDDAFLVFRFYTLYRGV